MSKQMTTFNMDADLHHKLKRYCAEHNVSMTEVIEKQIQKLVKNVS